MGMVWRVRIHKIQPNRRFPIAIHFVSIELELIRFEYSRRNLITSNFVSMQAINGFHSFVLCAMHISCTIL